MSGEFAFINNIKKKYRYDHIGDDCAVIPKDDIHDTVITIDMLVEDIDFRLIWTNPEFLGHKALAVSLTDTAAMGAVPKWALLSVGIPEKLWVTDFMDSFYAGWNALAIEFNVELIGGDISRVPDKLVLDCVVGGEVKKGKALLRSGASPGDLIFVSGELGGAAYGLELLESGITYQNADKQTKNLINRQLRPLYNSRRLQFSDAVKKASAAIDISDGLASDLGHICKKSNVGAAIYTERLPIDRSLLLHELPIEKKLDYALKGGEDFELILTASKQNEDFLLNAGFINIGEITQQQNTIELIMPDGSRSQLLDKGYTHFK